MTTNDIDMTRLISHVAAVEGDHTAAEAAIQSRFGVSYAKFELIARTLLGYSALLRDPDTDMLTHVFGYDEGQGMISLAEKVAEVQYDEE